MYRFPEKIGGNLPGVHYIRDVADANALIQSLVNFCNVSVALCAIRLILFTDEEIFD